jgi:GNAT superfamily N-acetyltransferase
MKMSSATVSMGQTGQASLESLEIIEVHDRRERDQFVKVPWAIYQGDPQWVPPLLLERKEFLNPRKHPFFLHGAATLFLALRGGRPVGRILVSDDPRYNEIHGANVGCFGMFETTDDCRVAHGLLDAAAGWLRDRGRTQMMGPIDYSTNYSCGLLIDGFDTPPRIFMNHNPPYYAALLESWGLAKAKDLYGWWFVIDDYLIKKFARLAARIRRQGNVQLRPFNLKDKKAEIARCKEIYNHAWERNWGFVQMTDPEFDYFAKDLTMLVPPKLLQFAEVDGEVAGFSLTLPDFYEAIRPLNGRLCTWGFPVGLARFLRNRRHIQTVRLLALGVLDKYRRRGISELLILKAAETTMECGFKGAELGWTLEDNNLINNTIEAVGARHYKTFRIYQKNLAPMPSGQA